MAQEDVRLSGTQLDSTGAAVEGLTVSLFAEGETTSAVATDTTDSNGEWDFTRTTPGRYDVQIVDGSETFRILARDKFQVTELTTRNPTTALPALSAYSTTSEASSLVATFGFRPSTESSGVETPDTPSDNDEGYINFTLSNDNATPQQWDAARITWIGTDVSDGTEDADLEFETMVAGSLATALKIGVSGATGSIIKDEDNMVSDSAVHLATQQSIKAYVDTEISSAIGSNNEWSEILANGNTSGANDVIIDNGQGLVVGHTAQVATGGVTAEFQVLGTGASDGDALLYKSSTTDTAAPTLNFAKSASGTIGTETTAVADNETLGIIYWRGSDTGDVASQAASIAAYVDGTAGSNDLPGRLVLATTADGANSPTEALRIDSSQHTIIPATKRIYLDGGGDSWISENTANSVEIVAGAVSSMKFGTTGGEVIVNDSGNDIDFRVEADAQTHALFVEGSSGGVFINESANANMTVGLTINQGANDDIIFELKSSDIDHGFTSGAVHGAAETDAYFTIRKRSATLGGTAIQSFVEDAAQTTNLNFAVMGGTADTAKTTAARGLTEFVHREHDGANNSADITADGNVFTIRARVGGSDLTRFLVDEDGDMYSVTAGQTFDDYDDLVALDYYDKVRSGMISPKDAIKASYGKYAEYNEKALIEMGVLGDTIANGGLTNQSQLSRLLTGGVRKLSENHMSLAEEVQSLRSDLAIAQKQLKALSN